MWSNGHVVERSAPVIGQVNDSTLDPKELKVFQVGERVKVLTPDGYAFGLVVAAFPEWYWGTCQCVVEFDELGRHEFPADSGLKVVERCTE